MDILVRLVFVFTIVGIVEGAMYLLKWKETKFIRTTCYIVMGLLAFFVGHYILTDFVSFAHTVAIAWIALAVVSAFKK
ncbi:hypothetical protein CEW92_05405 [Bacillaceae bacterium SAS-127]|nr:hypothetical protein CEW92_05405 [Bacillaceae bacterium SAS-127]